VKRLGLCGAFAMNAMLFSIPRYLGMDAGFQLAGLFDKLAFVFATLSFLAGGTYFFQRSWTSLRNGVLHIDLPISLGLIAAYAGSLYAWSRGVIGFAIAYNAVAIAISLAGKMSPLAAAVLMPCSSLVSLAIVFSTSRRVFFKRR
jgi:P-type Cu2+ transporter